MKHKKTRYTLLNTFVMAFMVMLICSCKKPRNGDYTYEENGTKLTYLSQSSGPYVLAKQDPYTNSSTVKFKNKHNTTLYIDDVPWTINGNSVSNEGSSSTTSSANSSFNSKYSYKGTITGKKEIDGTFTIVQVTHSYSNITIDSISGTFKYHK